MNKKGFTLIELTVSLVLVSIVMVSLTSSLVDIRNDAAEVKEISDIVIFKSTLARAINNDVVANDGIRFIQCTPNGLDCGLVLGNNSKRALKIVDATNSSKTNVTLVKKKRSDNSIHFYVTLSGAIINEIDISEQGQLATFKDYNVDTVKSKCSGKIPANCTRLYINGSTCRCVSEKITKTLLYKDTSNVHTTQVTGLDPATGTPIYKKTLSYIKNIDPTHIDDANPDNNYITTEGYTFSEIKATPYEYDSTLGTNRKNVVYKLSIGIYDGIDKNDETNNAYIYSTSIIAKDSITVGKEYEIRLVSDGDYTDNARAYFLSALELPMVIDNLEGNYQVSQLTEKFNVDFEARNPSKLSQITDGIVKIIPPKVSHPLSGATIFNFKGYYTGPDCSGTRVIEPNGEISVSSNFFTNNSSIYACWQ